MCIFGAMFSKVGRILCFKSKSGTGIVILSTRRVIRTLFNASTLKRTREKEVNTTVKNVVHG